MRTARGLACLAVLAGTSLVWVARPTPAAAECMFLPPWPKITAAVPSAREIVVGDVVATFDPSQLHTADGGPRTKALLVTEEIRGDRKVGDLVDIQYLLPNWPWGRSSDQTAPYPSCSYLQALPGERIAIAFGAIHPRGPVTSGDFTWIQPRTTYDAMGVVIAKPPSAGWGAGRQHVTVAELRRLAALPATDAVAPRTELTPAMRWPLLVVVGIVAGIVVLRRRSSDPQTTRDRT